MRPEPLTTQQRRDIERMLRSDVPIPRIVDRLGLEDADLIYDVLCESDIENKTTEATRRWLETCKYRRLDDSHQRVRQIMSRLRAERGRLTVLEQGCGEGTFQRELAETFPDCEFVGLDLSRAHIDYAHRHNELSNSRYYHADGSDFDEAGPFDVVYHVNVLEHVDDKLRYLDASLRLLKTDGALVVAFPTESYWRFWGTPKYLACLLLRRRFEIHAFSADAVARFLESRGLSIRERYHHTLCLPRRVYYYIGRRFLPFVGKAFHRLELRLRSLQVRAPLMFVLFHAERGIDTNSAEPASAPAMSLPGRIIRLTAIGFELFTWWLFSSMVLSWEVIRGRKTFFRQD